MDKNEELYLAECDCLEIQQLWKPKVRDEVIVKGKKETGLVLGFMIVESRNVFLVRRDDGLEYRQWKSNLIFLPSLDQILEAIGKKFSHLALHKVYRCVLNGAEVKLDELIYEGPTRKLACIKALKEIKKEEK